MQHNHVPVNGFKQEGLLDSTQPLSGGESAEARPGLTNEELDALIGGVALDQSDSAATQNAQPDERARIAEEWRETYPQHGGWPFRPWGG
jgi:hypothetical protein